MNVLHLAAGNLFGGIETMLVTMASERETAPSLVPIFGVCFEGRLANDLRTSGATVVNLSEVQARKPWTVYRARRNLHQFLKKNPMDAVICHSAWPLAVFGTAVRKTGCRLVLWLHDRVQRRHWVERWAKFTEPDLVICNSHYTAESLDALFPGVQREVVYCPVKSPERLTGAERNDLRKEFGAAANTPVIVMASRMQECKGHRVLLEALVKLPATLNWQAWIIGSAQRREEESYLQELHQIVNHNGIAARTRFLGQRSDVPRLMQAADIFCQPNMSPETFGIACVEALYAGLPALVSDFGGAQEIVTAQTGARVKPGGSTEVAERLRHFIVHPEARQAFRLTGPARARELCDPPMILQQLYTVLAGQ